MFSADFYVENASSWNTDNKILVRYCGKNKEVVLPERITRIDKDAFAGKEITSLTISDCISLWDIEEIRHLEHLRTLVFMGRDDHFSMSVSRFIRHFPALEVIECAHAKIVSFWNMENMQQKLPVFRFPGPETEKIRADTKGKIEPGKLLLFAPSVSPGKADKEIRCSLVETYLLHPEWYDEASGRRIENWLRKNGDKFLPLCMENGYLDLVNMLVLKKKMRFPARVYDILMQKAEDLRDTALKASLLSAKGEFHDLAKIDQRKETLAVNDLENPMRVHAMQKYWSWSAAEDGSLCLKKMKNDAFEALDQNLVYVPSEIGGRKVAMVSGAVFKNAAVREIIFPQEIEVIHGTLFESNCSVERVRFEGHVRVIPERCFLRARRLCQVTFAGQDQWIGEPEMSSSSAEKSEKQGKVSNALLIMQNAFDGCSGLRELFLNHAVLSDNAFNSSGLQKIRLTNIQVIPSGCFDGCSKMISADIRGTVLVESFGFCNCSDLNELHVSGDLISLKTGAFDGCRNLKKVYMHNVRYPGEIRKLFRNYRFFDCIEFVPADEP